MSIFETNLIWLWTATGGFLLTVTNAPFFFASARQLRAWFWTAIILFGEAVAFPLKFISLLVGLFAALPICAASTDIPDPGSVLQLTFPQFILVCMSVIFRVYFWPGIAMDWDRVRKWEQEVVRRPRGKLLAHIQARGHTTRERLNSRAFILGLSLAEGELKSSPALAAIPKQSLGLLLIFIASRAVGTATSPLSIELNILVIFCSIGVFLLAVSKQKSVAMKTDKRFLLALLPTAILMASRLTFTRWSIEISTYCNIISDLSRFSILTAILALLFREIEVLLETRPKTGAEVGFAPLDKKYSFLKMVTHTAQWLAKPAHLVSLFIHFDILLTTLRITLSW
ncbi:hypothetical protein EBR21_01175 [bacterium]|nr:hypothetical protein [bacterium]